MLQKIVDWVDSQGKKQPERNRVWRWVLGLGIGAIVLFFLTYMAWRAYKQGRELAKLKHERDVNVQRQIKAEKDALLEANTEKIDKHAETLVHLRNENKQIDAAIQAIEEEYLSTKERINALQTWDDIDKYLAGSNTDEPDHPGETG